MFEFEGAQFTLKQVQDAAEADGMSFDDYISKFKITPSKTDPPQTDPPSTDQEQSTPFIFGGEVITQLRSAEQGGMPTYQEQPKFIYKGKTFDEEQVTAAAEGEGMSVTDYTAQHGIEKVKSNISKVEAEELAKVHPTLAEDYISYQNITSDPEYQAEVEEAAEKIHAEPEEHIEQIPDWHPDADATTAFGMPVPVEPTTTITYTYDDYEEAARKLVAEEDENLSPADVTREQFAPKAIELAKAASEAQILKKYRKKVAKRIAGDKVGVKREQFNYYDPEGETPTETIARKEKEGKEWDLTEKANPWNSSVGELAKKINEKSKGAYKELVEEAGVAEPLLDISSKSLDKLWRIAINPDNSVNDRKVAYAEFQAGVVKHNVMVNDQHDVVDEIMALGEDLNSAEETMDLLNRSYNQSKIIQANFIGWGANMAAGALSVADDAIVNLAGVTNDALNMLLPVNIGLPGSFEMWEHDTKNTSYVERGAERLTAYANTIRGAVRQRQELTGPDGVYDLATFGDAVTDIFSSQVGNLAMMYFTGGYGLAVMAASEGGNKFAEMEEEIKGGANITRLQYYTTGIGYIGGEWLSERFSLGQVKIFKTAGKQIFKTTKGGIFTTHTSRAGIAFAGAKAYGKGAGGEYAAEFANKTNQNFWDHYVLEKDTYLFEGANEAGMNGAVMMGLGVGVPGVVNTVKNTFGTSSEMLQSNRAAEQLLLNEKRRKEYKLEANRVGWTAETRAAVKALDKNSFQIIKDGATQHTSILKRLDALSPVQKRQLTNLGQAAFNTKLAITKTMEGALPPAMKQEAIDKLSDQLRNINKEKDIILNTLAYDVDAEGMAQNLVSLQKVGVKVDHVDVADTKDIEGALLTLIDQYLPEKIGKDGKDQNKDKRDIAIKNLKKLAQEKGFNTSNGFKFTASHGFPTMVTVKNQAVTNNGVVMSHELFHASIETALIEGGVDIKEVAAKLRAFAVGKLKGAKEHFESVESAYDRDALPHETLTNFSDFIRKQGLSPDLTLWGKIFNVFSPFLKKNPELSHIKDGRDIFSFMMEYGARFEEGNVGDMFRADGTLKHSFAKTLLSGNKEAFDGISESKDLSNEIQALYDSQGVGAAFEISEMYRGMATKKAAKYRDVPGYATNKDLLVDEILTGKRGVVDMVMKYNPDSGVPISAYINKYLDARSIEAAQRVLDTEFTSDVTEAKDIVASEANEITETDAPKVSSRLRRQIKLEETEMNIVRRAAVRALMTAPTIKAAVLGKPQAFKDSLLKTYNTLLFKMVKNHMGTGDMYRMFVKQSYPVFNELMPLSFLLNGKMSIFYKPDINESGEQKRMTIGEANLSGIPLDKAGAGPLKWQRISPTPAEFYDWAMGKGMAANTKPARKTTMARLIARKLGIDATMEVLQNPVQPEYNETGAPIKGKTVNVMEVVGIVNINDMAESAVVGTVSAAIDVHPDLKFSKNLNPEEKDLLEKALDSANPSLEEIQLVESAIKGKRQGLKKHSREAKQTVRVVALAIGTKGITFDEAMTLPMVQHFFNAAVAKDKHKFQESILRAEVENVVPTTMFGSPISLLRWDNGNSENKSRVTKMINGLHSFLITKDYTAEKAAEIIVQLFVGSYAMKGPNVGYKSVKGFYEAFPFLAEVGYTLDKNTYKVKKGKNKGKIRTDYYLRKGGKPATPKKVRLLRSAIMAFSNGQHNQKIDNFQAEAEQSKKDVLELADILIAMYNDLGHNLDVATIISALNGATNSLLRLAAPLHTKITEVESKGDVVIEHEIPVNKVAKAMGTAITTGDKSLLIDLLNEQGITLLDKVIDAKLKEAGLRDMTAPWGIAPVKVLNSNGVIKWVAARYKNVAAGTKIYTVEDARILFSKNLNEEFNNILEESGSMPASKIISPTEAIKRGKKASRYLKNQGIMISAAEDFVGLMYKMLAKGKTGETQLEWLLDKLVIPYDVAVDNVSIARLLKSEQLRKISKSAKLKGMLGAEAFDGMTGEDAVRLYIWNLRGVAKGKFVKETYVDMAADYMSKNPELKAYADAVHAIAGAVAYAAPNARWAHGSIEMDLVGGINGELRALELEQSGWSLNVKEIFSEDNLNKLEALYGVNYVTALKNILQRMKSGRNRIDQETDKTSKKAQGWISNQVGAIMFLNMRSALLQGLSALNYINTTDHNPLQAIRRMLNVPQYAKDTKFLLGSAFMKDRRMGMRIDVNEEDVARASRDTGNVISRALKIALNKGFIPTRLMDTAAIVIGGAGFYRSRINTYVDSGMSIASAEKMAFADFRKATINSQQSSDPRMVSQQQASTMGRFVLQFGNTPGQYTRIQIKAVKDIINGRGDMKAHIGKILYYGMIQQALFTFAQQALWVALLDDDDEWITSEEGRGLVDGMLSSTLRGLGLYGAIIDTAMRTAKVWEKETSKGYMGSNEKVVIEALGISPSVKSIAKKTTNAMNISKYRGDDFGIDPYSLHSPEVEQAAWLLEGTANIPSKRILDKMHHIESIMFGQNEAWQNIALFFGFQEWQVGAGEGGKKAKQRKLDKKGLIKPKGRRGSKKTQAEVDAIIEKLRLQK